MSRGARVSILFSELPLQGVSHCGGLAREGHRCREMVGSWRGFCIYAAQQPDIQNVPPLFGCQRLLGWAGRPLPNF